MKADAERGSGSTDIASGWFFVVAGAAVVAWLIFQLCWMPGHILGATRFILGDPGSYLYAIGRWQAGEALYRDFAWQYGPLALGWYRAFAAIGGNSPLTLVLASSLTFAAAWILVARLVMRLAGWRWGGLLSVLGLLPVMSASGAMALNGLHGAVEMLLLSVCATVLAAGGNGRRQPWQLGFLAGLLHWVRFGPHVAALAAILLIAAWQRWPERTDLRDWMGKMGSFAGCLLAGYALTVTPLVIWIFSALPWPGAVDQLWPSYMVAVYAATFPNRWPQISSLSEFVVTWLPALVGVGLMVCRLGEGWRRGDQVGGPARSGAVAGVMFFPLHYLICCTVLFRTDNPIMGHLWLAWPGLALAAGLKSRLARGLVVAVVLPALMAMATITWVLAKEEQDWQARPLALPNGQQLWFHGSEVRRFQALQAALGPAPQTHRLAVLLAGGGVHHFFGTQRVGRQWWFLPEMVRPWEEAAVRDALLRHDMVLMADRDEVAKSLHAVPGTAILWLPLPRQVAGTLQSHLRTPRHLEGIGLLFDVQP